MLKKKTRRKKTPTVMLTMEYSYSFLLQLIKNEVLYLIGCNSAFPFFSFGLSPLNDKVTLLRPSAAVKYILTHHCAYNIILGIGYLYYLLYFCLSTTAAVDCIIKDDTCTHLPCGGEHLLLEHKHLTGHFLKNTQSTETDCLHLHGRSL